MMSPFTLQRITRSMMMIFLTSSLVVDRAYSSPRRLKVTNEEHTEYLCPPCELLLSKLGRTGSNGKLAQDIRVQERGEPKSGTSVSYYWASASLIHACDYLQELFGKETGSY